MTIYAKAGQHDVAGTGGDGNTPVRGRTPRPRWWITLGIALALLVGVEVALRIAFTLRAQGGVRTADYRVAADAYGDTPWRERYFEEFKQSHKVGWHPYVYWRRRPFGGEFINIDARGLRRTWNPPECAGPSQSRRSILVFGGSVVWGEGARDDHTIPSLVSRAIAQGKGGPVCVTNFGESGYVTSQELIALLSELRDRGAPHLAIFIDGYNDAFAAFQDGQVAVSMNEWRRRREFNLLFRPTGMMSEAWSAMATQSGLYRFSGAMNARLYRAGLRKRGVGDDGTPRGEDLAQQVVSAYGQNVHIAERLGIGYGFRTLFYWQPAVWAKAKVTPYEVGEREREGKFGEFYQKVGAALAADRTLSARNDFRDLTGIIAGRPEPLFIDSAHLSEQGNTLLADQIAGDVRRVLDAPPATSSGRPTVSTAGPSLAAN